MRRLLVLLSVLTALVLFVPTLVVAQTASPEPSAARTDARYFLPFGLEGVKGTLTVTETIGGSCTPHSLAAPHRPDAWDCIDAGGQIHDPCFENPHAAEDAPVELVCATSPFTNEVVVLSVDGPLVRDKEDPPGQEPYLAWDLPWGLELGNGDRCVLLHEIETSLAGETVHYGCEDGGSVFGVVDRRFPVWTVNYLAPDAVSSSLVDVTAAWS
jgi:hypothetical protein